MAPYYISSNDQMALTPVTIISGRWYYANGIGNIQTKKVETKKERIKRISVEKMLASWKTYNQKTQTIIEIKQICKPVHRVGYMGIRNK